MNWPLHSWHYHYRYYFVDYERHFMVLSQLYLIMLVWHSNRQLTVQSGMNGSAIRWLERIWNLSFAVFSGAMAGLFFYDFDFRAPLGWQIRQQRWASLGIFLFCFTKSLEYIDTLIMVLRAKPIKTLHWSHHFLTAMFAWFAAQRDLHPGYLFFFVSNAIVHTFMYFYYFLVSFPKCKEQLKSKAKWLTLMQLAQFYAAVANMWFFFGLKSLRFWLAFTMYSYYIVMFTLYYRKRYQTKKEQ